MKLALALDDLEGGIEQQERLHQRGLVPEEIHVKQGVF